MYVYARCVFVLTKNQDLLTAAGDTERLMRVLGHMEQKARQKYKAFDSQIEVRICFGTRLEEQREGRE